MTKKIFYGILLFTLTGGNLRAQNTSQPDSIAKLNQPSPTNNAVDSVPPVQPHRVKKDNRPINQRLSFGISTAFWINSNNTYFEFSPLLTYHFPKTYSIGGGPTYVYNKDRVNNTSLHGWGGKVYSRANFTNWLYGWTEYQGIANQHITGFENNKPVKDTWYVDSWFLSLGLNIPLGRRSINVQLLYDVLYKESTSYTYSPVTYRIGFGF